MNAAPSQSIAFRWTLRCFIGAVFLYAGTLKLLSPQDFADGIAGFRLLPLPLVNPLALGLPPFEILTGALLIIGWQRRAAALAALVMMSVFTLALISAWARGLQVDCGCFGHSGPPTPWRTALTLGRDLFLLGAAALLYRQTLPPAPAD